MASSWEITRREQINTRALKLQGGDSKHQKGRVEVGGRPVVEEKSEVLDNSSSYFAEVGPKDPQDPQDPTLIELPLGDRLETGVLVLALAPVMAATFYIARDPKFRNRILGLTVGGTLLAACSSAVVEATRPDPRVVVVSPTPTPTETQQSFVPSVTPRPTESGSGGSLASCQAEAVNLFLGAIQNNEGKSVTAFRSRLMQFLLPPGRWTEDEKTKIVDANGNPVYPGLMSIAQQVGTKFGSELTLSGVAVGDGAVLVYKDAKGDYVWINGDGLFARMDANGKGIRYLKIPAFPGGKTEVAVRGGCSVVMATKGDIALAVFNPVTQEWEKLASATATPAPTQKVENTATPQPTPKEIILKQLSTEKPVFQQQIASFDQPAYGSTGWGIMFPNLNPEKPSNDFYLRVNKIYSIKGEIYVVAYIGPNDSFVAKVDTLRFYNGLISQKISISDLAHLVIDQNSRGSAALSLTDYPVEREAKFALGRAVNSGEILKVIDLLIGTGQIR